MLFCHTLASYATGRNFAYFRFIFIKTSYLAFFTHCNNTKPVTIAKPFLAVRPGPFQFGFILDYAADKYV